MRIKVLRPVQHGVVTAPRRQRLLVCLIVFVLRRIVPVDFLEIFHIPACLLGKPLILLIQCQRIIIGLICIVHGLFARVVLPGHVLAGAVDVRPVRIELGAILLFVFSKRLLRQRARTRRKTEII